MRFSARISLGLAALLLTLPGSARAGESHVVVVGDTLWQLAEACGCTLDQLRAANGMERGQVLRLGAEIQLPVCRAAPVSAQEQVSREHTVVAGDTLERIARRYDTSVEALELQNDLEDSLIRVGLRLSIPRAGVALTLARGQSRGQPGEGSLQTPTQLPHSAAYYRRRLPRTWGTQQLVTHTQASIEALRKRSPGLHRLAVGDISDDDGGPISGHRTHQSGRDIDLGFYFSEVPEGYPEQFAKATRDSLDADATWDLLETFVVTANQPGGVQLVYLDYEIQKWLYPAAKRDGWSQEELAWVFEYPDGRGAEGRVVKHLWNHQDHLHVRFSCPPADASCH